MIQPNTTSCISGGGYKSVICMVVSVAFVAISWHAVAESRTTGKSAIRGDLSISVVDDTELSTIHGKGYRYVVNFENSLSVILWDEGKRKGLCQDRVSGTVTRGQLDVHYNGQPLPD